MRGTLVEEIHSLGSLRECDTYAGVYWAVGFRPNMNYEAFCALQVTYIGEH